MPTIWRRWANSSPRLPEPEALAHPGHVVLHGLRRDEQLLADLLVGQPLQHQRGHLALAVAQRAVAVVAVRPSGAGSATAAAAGAAGIARSGRRRRRPSAATGAGRRAAALQRAGAAEQRLIALRSRVRMAAWPASLPPSQDMPDGVQAAGRRLDAGGVDLGVQQPHPVRGRGGHRRRVPAAARRRLQGRRVPLRRVPGLGEDRRLQRRPVQRRRPQRRVAEPGQQLRRPRRGAGGPSWTRAAGWPRSTARRAAAARTGRPGAARSPPGPGPRPASASARSPVRRASATSSAAASSSSRGSSAAPGGDAACSAARAAGGGPAEQRDPAEQQPVPGGRAGPAQPHPDGPLQHRLGHVVLAAVHRDQRGQRGRGVRQQRRPVRGLQQRGGPGQLRTAPRSASRRPSRRRPGPSAPRPRPAGSAAGPAARRRAAAGSSRAAPRGPRRALRCRSARAPRARPRRQPGRRAPIQR